MMYKQNGKEPCSESTRFTRAEAVASVRDGILVIPEGKTSLDFDFAFFVVRDDLPKVHTLVIPSSVTRIASMSGDPSSGPYGYQNNPFSAVVVSEDNPHYASRAGVLFTKSMDKLICYPCGKPDRSYSVPMEVKTIGTEAFLNVEHLEQIYFQEGTSVEEFAFRACAQIDFPEMVSVYKKESEYHVTLDGMPDCDYRGSRYSIGEHVVVTNESRIGANRAVLVLDSYQYPWHKLKDSFTWRDDWFLKDGLVLHDATTGESLTWKSAPLTTSHPKSAAYAGFVLNEDNCPVVNATVQLKSDNATLSAATDDYGHFLLPLKDTKGDYELTVIADGLQEQQFQDVWEPYSFTMGSRSDVLTYPEAATFKKGQQATIILPTKPNATWGRFYKLARVDDGKIVFNREMTPQANVPYVIFPERDFSIDLTKYDKESLPEAGRQLFPDMMDAENPWGLYGTYQSRVAHHMGVIGSSLLDSTPDCQVGTPNSFPRIGAFHAYLLGYHTGSQYDDGPKMMFVDE